MKSKAIITLVSLVLNLVLFAALIRTTTNNRLDDSTPATVFYIQHLPDAIISQN